MSEYNEHIEHTQLEGRYANNFELGHNALEFLIDFGQRYQESQKSAFHTRIITSPVYAKALLVTLQKAISQYEISYGCIPEDKMQTNNEENGD